LPLVIATGAAVAALQARGADQSVLQGEGSSLQLTSAHSSKHAPHHKKGRFQIAGSVHGLYPGDSTDLMLTVSNPFSFPIVVKSISTTVGSPRPSCKALYLTVGSFSGHLKVTSHGSAQVSVPVVLAHAAPNGCQGVRFGLEYHGLARKG
jgi:hypothetical protein